MKAQLNGFSRLKFSDLYQIRSLKINDRRLDFLSVVTLNCPQKLNCPHKDL